MQIHLKQFEGPMALLLYLIRKEEMDIYDIEIHTITKQYLDYVRRLKSIDLEQAGDFIAMAATLIQIKAKMLMPSYDLDDEEEPEDPRKPLVERLLEYQKYQDAGKELYKLPLLGRDTFKRGASEDIPEEEGDLVIEEENALFSLISTYRSIVKRAKKATHRVATKLQSIAARILEIKDRLVPGKSVELRDLLDDINDFRKTIVTFLSSLELGKLGFVRLSQEQNYGPLYIEATKTIGDDVLSKVEEYDSLEENEEEDFGVLNASLSEEEKNYLRDENAELTERKEVETVKGSLSEDEENLLDSSEAATDEEILEAEKELNLTEDNTL